MLFFSILAGIDKIMGNKLGLGEKFNEGFYSLGGLALTVIGIYSLSPIISDMLLPVLNPISNVLRTDPSVFISSILAPDFGGLSTSMAIGNTVDIGRYNGVILASTLGSLISFTIPVAIETINREDFEFFIKGVLAGIITVPVGMIVGGVLLKIGYMDMLKSIFPVVIFSILVIYFLNKSPKKTINAFQKIGKGVIIISTVGMVLSIINYFFKVESLNSLAPFKEGAVMILEMAIVLSGAYPLLYFLSDKLSRHLEVLENRFNLNKYSILGLMSSLANCIPMFGIYKEMDDRGKVINSAFAVSGAFTFGGQLAYISSMVPDATNAFIISKLVAGISAVILASIMLRRESEI